ncbi:MAG: hypothetical protein HZA93_27480 [Verrucomicrobia bacterium]|nr:hypothetical protein [Verrucomicrobiota bacterium]
MRRAFPTAALIFAWLCANGALWDAAQLFAWAKMFAGYAQTLTVTHAIEQTFDASKPCEMCVSIAKAKEIEQTRAPQSIEHSTEKLVLACELPPRTVFEVPRLEWPDAPSRVALIRTERVPVPPPRA